MLNLPAVQVDLLVIQDLEQFYEPITRWLSELDYQVTVAKSFQEALNLYSKGGDRARPWRIAHNKRVLRIIEAIEAVGRAVRPLAPLVLIVTFIFLRP